MTVIVAGRRRDAVVCEHIIGRVDEINGDRAVVEQEEQVCIDAETKEQERPGSDGILQVRVSVRKCKIDDGDDNDDEEEDKDEEEN